MKAILSIAVVLMLLCITAGCASLPGVEISDEEAQACKAQTCSVWTPNELEGLAKHFFLRGYQAGVKSI